MNEDIKRLVEAAGRLIATVECAPGYIENRSLMNAADEARQALASLTSKETDHG